MDISVVIPCYNSEDFILKTVESIAFQTYTPNEIIIVNDASTDSSLKILLEIQNKYRDLVKIFNFETNNGVSCARNYGVKAAKSNYILFMDSDDIADPLLIETYISKKNKLKENNEERHILFYSAYVQIDKNDNIISGISKGFQTKKEETLGYLFVRNFISTSGTLVNKALFIESGGFNEKINYSEDWDLWLRLSSYGKFLYIDKPLVKVRRHINNSSSEIDTMLNAERAILNQYDIEYIRSAIFRRRLSIKNNTLDYVSILFRLNNWEDGFLELKKLLNEGNNYYNLYFSLALYYLKTNNYEVALEYFYKTVNLNNNNGAALNNIGALLLLKGSFVEAKRFLDLAISYFPQYIDAKSNYKLLEKKVVTVDEIRFTWRELRGVLTSYDT